MNFEQVTRCFAADREPIVAALAADPWLWDIDTRRQRYPGAAHGDTRSVIFRGPMNFDRETIFDDVLSTDYPVLQALVDVVKPLVQEVYEAAGGVHLGRVMLVSLKAGGHIGAHVDEGLYAQRHRRYHAVVQSDDGNQFRCGDEFTFMRPGEVWQFNHRTEHEVWNKSARERIHLIVDVV